MNTNYKLRTTFRSRTQGRGTNYSSGLSLLEIVIYTALLALVAVVLTTFASRVIQRNAHARITDQALDNARGAMSTLVFEIRHAGGIYDPTSTFDVHPGQLSLATTENLPAGEDETYVDFYIDDDRLYRKREGQNAELITSEQVRVTNFVVTYLNQTSSAPAIRIQLAIAPATGSASVIAEGTVSLVSTASLRSY